MNSLAALSKCTNLRSLDLSWVSESIPIEDLFRSIRFLQRLESLCFPRSSGQPKSDKLSELDWPPGLRKLNIKGGWPDVSTFNNLQFPSYLSHLSIRYHPRLDTVSLDHVFRTCGAQIRSLEVLAPLPNMTFPGGAHAGAPQPLDYILKGPIQLPKLGYLKISVDLISDEFFANDPSQSPLTRLYLHCYEPNSCRHIDLDTICDALGSDPFAKLRILGLDRAIPWRHFFGKGGEVEEMIEDIDEMLKSLAEEDDVGDGTLETKAGVVRFKGP